MTDFRRFYGRSAITNDTHLRMKDAPPNSSAIELGLTPVFTKNAGSLGMLTSIE
jgi:hypothetical protein